MSNNVTVSGGGGWVAAALLLIMFWDFNGKYDLYDAIMAWLAK